MFLPLLLVRRRKFVLLANQFITPMVSIITSAITVEIVRYIFNFKLILYLLLASGLFNFYLKKKLFCVNVNEN